MTKWLSMGALGVLLLIAAAFLITSGINLAIGQILGLVGVVLVLVSVVVFPLATRWAIFRTKGRAVVFGVGILGRVIGTILLVAVVALGLYLAI
jgi:hypothetical protein